MGQFSWLDCITREQILDDVRRDSYVLIPKEFGGGHIKESCYDGYGNFGGHDIYDLVVDWNAKHLEQVWEQKDEWKCDWIEGMKEDFDRIERGEDPKQEKRIVGICLACYDEDNGRLKYPIKITHSPYAVYENCEPSLSDPDQGWSNEDFYYEDDELEEDEEW